MSEAPSHRKRLVAFAGLSLLVALALGGGILSLARLDRSQQPPEFPPLSSEERDLSSRLERHVTMLAGTIGERNLWHYAELERARSYIKEELAATGFSVSEQGFFVDNLPVFNVEARASGGTRPEEIVVVGAHYDSLPGTPGANDNATGVAAVLELARIVRKTLPDRTIRFVLFVNEEPPFFKTDRMGSLVYAEEAARRQEKIVAMFSLETIGYYSDEEKSQSYPFPLGLWYPDKGNFIGFVSNIASRALLKNVLESFHRASGFPAEGVTAPSIIPGIDWSDHWSFWKQGYPAIMVTDTALYRYPYYHSAFDTPDRIDPDRLARVVIGMAGVVRDLVVAN